MKLAKEMLIECLTLGHVTNEFAAMAMEVGRRVIYSDRNVRLENKEDACSIYYVKFMKKWQKINPENNIKAYLSQMANNTLIDEKRKFKTNFDKNNNFFNHVVINATNRIQQFEEEQKTLLETIDMKSGHDLGKQERIALRREVFKLLNEGLSQYRVALVTGLNKSTLSRWVKEKEKLGKAFIFKDNRRKGKGKRIRR